MGSAFDRATALELVSRGQLAGVLSKDFWVTNGPNGGYLAAIALSGARAFVSDTDRYPRALHVRFLSSPKAAAFELHTEVVREGRSMTSIDVSMRQEAREFLRASACFSTAYGNGGFQQCEVPSACTIAEAQLLPKLTPLNHQIEALLAIGSERENARAETGGYLRFVDRRPLDMLALAALWDAWPPAVFFHASGNTPVSGTGPTVEATVYFRVQLPLPHEDDMDCVLFRSKSTTAQDGLVEEDAELWSLKGQLLVQSRQLALYV
jgi:acyl-CoA thioesterase